MITANQRQPTRNMHGFSEMQVRSLSREAASQNSAGFQSAHHTYDGVIYDQSMWRQRNQEVQAQPYTAETIETEKSID